MDSIYELTKRSLAICQDRVTVQRNKVHYRNLVLTDFDLVGEIDLLKKTIAELIIVTATKYPIIAQELQEHLSNYKRSGDGIIHHSALMATLNCLLEIENPKNQEKNTKVFISHSSKDEKVIRSFVSHILELGVGLDSIDIFCTSIEDMSMNNGDDIRSHIKNNLLSSDFSLLLISKAYKTSEICLNEMGAVWAVDNTVRLYLLPDVDYESIGWLNDTKKAEKLSDSIALDSLHKELLDFYHLPDKGITWSKNREEFLLSLNEL